MASQTKDLKRSCIVYVDRSGGYLEYVVFKPPKGLVGSDAKPSVLWQAVTFPSLSWQRNVGMGGPNLYRFYDLDYVHVVSLGKNALLM